MTEHSSKYEEHLAICDQIGGGPIEKYLLVSSLESMYQGYVDALNSLYQMMAMLQIVGGEDPFTELDAYKREHPQLAETCDVISQMYWCQKELKDRFGEAYQHLRDAIVTNRIREASTYLRDNAARVHELQAKIHQLNMAAVEKDGSEELQQFLDFMKGNDDDDLSKDT